MVLPRPHYYLSKCLNDKFHFIPCFLKVSISLQGKKTLQVNVPVDNIYDVDYSWFFDQMSKEISKNINVPSYVDVISADFSSTTPVHRIVSQITLMSSLQEFFDFK